jgi:hypothetical protein
MKENAALVEIYFIAENNSEYISSFTEIKYFY